MINIKELSKALKHVAEEKGLEPEKVLEAIESSVAAAYKKEYAERGAIVKCKLDMKTGELSFWQVKIVVDETTVRFVEEKTEEELQRDEKSEKSGESTVVSESDEIKLPRYNPERHILLADAKKVKRDAALDEEIVFPLETHDDFGRIAAQTA